MAGGIPWTETERELLRRYYPTSTRSEVERILPGRSWGTIRMMAHRLSLSPRTFKSHRLLPETIIGHLNERNRGYFAGILDGEGSIIFSRKRQTGEKFYYHLAIAVSNTNEALIRWLHGCIPAWSYTSTRTEGRFGTKPIYGWRMTKQASGIVLCREIAPYLIVKREQAELMAHGFDHLSAEERDRLYWRMRELKRE